MVQENPRIIIRSLRNIRYRVQCVLRVLHGSDIDRALEVHRRHGGVGCSDVGADNLLIMIINSDRVILVLLLLEVPYLDGLVHGARNYLRLVEEHGAYEVIVGVELVYAGSRLETKDVDVEVFAGEGEAILARKLTGHRNAILANKEGFLLNNFVLLQIYFIHFDEAVVCRYNKLQMLVLR